MLLPPDALHPLVVASPAFVPQESVNQPLTPTHVEPGQLPDPLPELVLLDLYNRPGPALGGEGLVGHDMTHFIGPGRMRVGCYEATD